MTKQSEHLQAKFEPRFRFNNFGSIIVEMHVKGFRCHVDTTITFDSPITAFTGLNGTGKTTLVQLAATAYKGALRTGSYSISDFMVRSKLDPQPYQPEASLNFSFWNERQSTSSICLSRNIRDNRWNGYKNRPKNMVYFAGINLYLPRIEERDFLVSHAKTYKVLDSNPVPDLCKLWTSKILGHNYEELTINRIGHSQASQRQALSAKRGQHQYSETHMGFGEARVQFLIQNIEALPDKSIVLLEEPETSLHQHAQYEFGNYIVDVSNRKGHQIIMSTHSEYMVSAFPCESIKFLYPNPDGDGILQLCRISAREVNSLLTQGYEKALTILVEDSCAKAILSEILSKIDRNFLKTVNINCSGGYKEIKTAMRAIKNTGLKIAAVLDQDIDIGQDQANFNIFKLPGTQPPEKEMLSCDPVKAWFRTTLGEDTDQFIAVNPELDHHKYFSRLAQMTSKSEDYLLGESAHIYANSIPSEKATELVSSLKAIC